MQYSKDGIELSTNCRQLKVGDRVRIKKRLPGNFTGGCDFDKPNGDAGKIGEIIDIKSWGYRVDNADGYLGRFGKSELKHCKSVCEEIHPKPQEELEVEELYVDGMCDEINKIVLAKKLNSLIKAHNALVKKVKNK